MYASHAMLPRMTTTQSLSFLLTPQEGPEDYVFPRRQYVVVVHALYFRDPARAEAAAQTLAQVIALRCERLQLHV